MPMHRGERVDAAAQLAGGVPAHRDVVLLHRRRRDRVDGGGHREPLQLAHEPGGRVLGDHQARVDAGVVREERGQAVAALRVQEAVGAALGHAREVGDRDGEEVEHVADRGAVEVAVRLDAAVERDDGVVDRGGELPVRDLRGVEPGVARGAVHLRRAAERVRVLHDGVLGAAVALPDRGAGDRRDEVRRGDLLAGLRAEGDEVRGPRRVRAEQRLRRHRGGDVRGGEQRREVAQREGEHPEHAVGAVDEREPLLLRELDRRDARRGERLRRLDALAGRVADRALPHQHERAVRERGEVAGAAERAVLVHDRRDPGVEDGEVGVERRLADAGAARREGLDAQQHERADDLPLDLRPGAGGVAADEAALEAGALVGRDEGRRERAEPGRDAVVRVRVDGERVDDRAGGGDARPRLRIEHDARAVPGDRRRPRRR